MVVLAIACAVDCCARLLLLMLLPAAPENGRKGTCKQGCTSRSSRGLESEHRGKRRVGSSYVIPQVVHAASVPSS